MLELREACWRNARGFSIDRVSLALRPGEVVGLMGPNGAGKTTVLKLLTGEYAPSSGQALLDGAPVRSVARKRFARRVAVVRQERTFAFPMSCLDLAMTGRTPYLGLIGGVGGRERAMALEALERVGARKLANASFEEISGGEKQRVMLARALLQEPGALLLDEAFSAMDERRAAGAMRLVRELARERNMAVLSIMHDLHIAHAMTDRLVLMEEGRIVAEGTPDEAVGSEAMRRLTGMRIEVHENGSLTTCVLPESE